MLPAIIIRDFRNFDDAKQLIGPLSRLNVFIGPNNSGKSNILRYIRDIVAPIHNRSSKPEAIRPQISSPRFSTLKTGVWPIAISVADAEIDRFVEGIPGPVMQHREYFRSVALKISEMDLWAVEPHFDGNGRLSVPTDGLTFTTSQDAMARTIWAHKFSMSGGGAPQWHHDTINAYVRSQIKPISCLYIPSFRQIKTRLSEFSAEYDLSVDEVHIIDQLAELAHPAYDKQELKEDFEKLRRFVGRVLGRPDIRIEIPNDRKTINVETDGAFVPIEALGSGVHELFMLAARILVDKSDIVLLEEPEAHLHPAFQRRFLEFLLNETKSIYFISTHSAQVIDIEHARVFGVKSKDGRAIVSLLLRNQERRRMCQELGYRPSDLLQSNCVIWAEGPSDRIYLVYWLSVLAPDLVEGVHYSIMFYGGKLLSHLKLEDGEFQDFVGLLPINRHPVVVMDSDLGSSGQSLRGTKVRVIQELSDIGHAWVTYGREIENYVPADIRLAAIKTVHPAAVSLSSGYNRHSKPLDYLLSDGTKVEKGFDKVRIARTVVEMGMPLNQFDLKNEVEAVIAYVRRANI